MKLSLFLTVWIYVFSVLSQQTLIAQEKLKKEKIYTLASDEIIEYDENALGLYQDKLGYIVVTAKSKDSDKISRHYHIQGQIFGPFNRYQVDKPVFNWTSWGFIDSQGDESQVFFNNQKAGIHKDPEYALGLKIAKESSIYLVYNMLEGTSTLIYNGTRYGPYLTLQDYYLNSDGSRCAIIYSESPDEWYVLFNNGEKKGPYSNINDFRFLEGPDNKWVISAEKKDMGENLFTVVTNEGEIGVFEKHIAGNSRDTCGIILANGENYLMNVVKNQKIYLLANDELYGPYDDFVKQISIGKAYNRFSYIVGKNSEFYFKGIKGFSTNISKYYVSDTRKSIAIIKKAGTQGDSLIFDDIEFKGIYPHIVSLKFAPQGEEWALLNKNADGSYHIYFYDNQKFGPFWVDDTKGIPPILLGKNCKNWAFAFQDSKTNHVRLIVNNEERLSGFVGNIIFTEENGEEYFSWFSIDDQTIYLNKLGL